MNKIRIITLLVVGVMMLSLQGCSLWKRDQILPFWQKKEVIPPIKDFSYNFQGPVRKTLSLERMRSLKLPPPRANATLLRKNLESPSKQYYSANGNICRVISASGSEVVCAVSGTWKYPPSILANSLGR